MARGVINTILSFKWWWRVVFGLVLLAMLVHGPVVAKKYIYAESDREYYLYLFLSILLIVIVSSLVSAVAALLTVGQAIHKAEETVSQNTASLNQQVDQFQGISSKITDQLKEAREFIDLLHNEVTRAHEIVRIALESFGRSIIYYRDLMEIEAAVKSDGEIWVLTSALELEGDELKDIIRRNFKKGIKYTYLIPKEEGHLKEKMRRLANEWKDYCTKPPNEQICCLLVPKHFAYMTVLIYGPSEDKPTVLVKFPKSDIFEKEKYPFIYRVNERPEEAWKTFVNALQTLIDANKRCTNVEPLEFNF